MWPQTPPCPSTTSRRNDDRRAQSRFLAVNPLVALWNFQPRGDRLRLVFVTALMTVAAGMEMLGIGAILPVIQLMQEASGAGQGAPAGLISRWLGTRPDHATLMWVLLGLLAFYLAKNLYLTLLDMYQYRLLSRLQARLSASLMRNYLRRPYAFHLQVNSSKLIRNVTTEIDTIYYYAMVPFGALVAESLVILALFVLVLVLDPVGALVLTGCGVFLLAVYYLLLRDRMAAIGAQLQASSGKKIQYAQEGLGAVKELKVMGREPYFEEAFSAQVDGYSRALRRALVIHNFPPRLLESFFVALFVGMAILLTRSEGSGDTFPMLAVYAAAAFRLIPSLNRIMTALGRLRQGGASLQLVMADLGEEPAPAPSAPEGAPSLRDAIDVVDLRFRYEGADSDALAGITLTIHRGEMVAFVGKSGSGKTTVVDCILGLLEPTGGRIEVDGTAISAGMVHWQRQIGYIPQNIYLTDDSLRKNVALGVDDAAIDDARVWRSLEAAQLAGYVRGLPAGMHTEIGEGGVRLSGGQRQRIGIARAMYHDPGVVVLDEATSALDVQTEKAIVETISALKGERTILVIAHRLSTIEDCDRVFVLDGGRLVEERIRGADAGAGAGAAHDDA